MKTPGRGPCIGIVAQHPGERGTLVHEVSTSPHQNWDPHIVRLFAVLWRQKPTDEWRTGRTTWSCTRPWDRHCTADSWLLYLRNMRGAESHGLSMPCRSVGTILKASVGDLTVVTRYRQACWS